MSRLTELIARVERVDADLAAELASEVKVLGDRREFGLNFERHVPETVELPRRKVRRGDKVRFVTERRATHASRDGRLWIVAAIRKVDGIRIATLVEAYISADENPATAMRA